MPPANKQGNPGLHRTFSNPVNHKALRGHSTNSVRLLADSCRSFLRYPGNLTGGITVDPSA